MKVVRPRESKAETQPQPQPALLRFVGDDFPVPHAMHSALFALHTPKMGSVLTINTGCWFALTLGRAAPAANSIRGAIYHLMSRGDRREEIFRDDLDRKSFLQALGAACEKTGWQLHAYCLMDDHFHLVVETPRANLVEGMKRRSRLPESCARKPR